MIPLPEFKTCNGCGLRQPFDTYHYAPHKRGPGKATTWDCRVCKRRCASRAWKRVMADPVRRERARKMNREWAALERQRDPTRQRARSKEHLRRLYADPDRRAEYLVAARILRRGGRDSTENTMRPKRPTIEPYRGPSSADTVPAEPLRDYLVERFAGWTVGEIHEALRCGTSDRLVYRILTGADNDRITLDAADRILTVALSRPDLLNALYPLEAT